MQVCACLWGGAYNPIIPVCSELPERWRQDPPLRNSTGEELARGYIDFFEPDVFVESEPGLAARAGVGDRSLTYSEPRVVSLAAFFEPKEGNQTKTPFGLSIFDLYRDLYDREFKFVRRHNSRVVLFENGTTSDAFVEAAFGGFPTDELFSPLVKAFGQMFDPLRLVPSSENWAKVVKESYLAPLLFTAHGLKRDGGGYSSGPTLFVVDPNSPIDLIDLWNLRQFLPSVLPINVDWTIEGRDFVREFITLNYRPLPGNPNGIMIHTTVQFGRSISEEHAKKITELLDGLPQESWSYHRWHERIWDVDRMEDRVVRPRRVRISAAATEVESPVSLEQKDRSIRFPSLAPEFANLFGDGAARWVNVLRLHSYASDESIAVVLPSDFTQESLMRLRAGGEGAIVSREGLVLPQHFKNHREYLDLLSGTQAMVEWLKGHGIAAKPSDAGRITDQVLNSIGGCGRASLLAHRATLETLDDMSKSVRVHRDGKKEEFPDRAKPVKVWESLIKQRNKPGQWMSNTNLDAFVKAGVLKLGLSVQCPNCMKRNWYGLHDLDEQIVCERCLKRFDFPQGDLNFSHAPWQYRVVGPFSVPNFAEGAYGTVLALRVFSKNLGSDTQLTYCTGLDFTLDQNPNEIDFAFWYRRDRLFDRDEETLLAFGEAKSLAKESFRERDLQRMERLAKAFPGAFLVFATLKDSLSESERSAIGKLALWGREHLADGRPRSPVIVLTGMEMFSEWHIKHTWENAGGRHKELGSPAYIGLDNLWDLADLTQQLYLDLPDKYASLRQVVLAAAPEPGTSESVPD